MNNSVNKAIRNAKAQSKGMVKAITKKAQSNFKKQKK